MPPEKEFLAGFNWAVPSAFIDALARCRFEEGDTLYDTPAAYGPDWGVARTKIKNSVQVRFPSRGPTGTNEDENAVFYSNWDSPVHVDVYEYPKVSLLRKHETTQGRLYSMLWRGDLSLLESSGSTVNPPENAKSLLKKLEQIRDVAQEISKGSPVFVMPYDHAGRLTHAKLATLRGILKKQTTSDPVVISCRDAGIVDAEVYSPTVGVAVFPASGMSHEGLEESVKQAFYKPSKTAKNPRFYLNRHGVVFSKASSR